MRAVFHVDLMLILAFQASQTFYTCQIHPPVREEGCDPHPSHLLSRASDVVNGPRID